MSSRSFFKRKKDFKVDQLANAVMAATAPADCPSIINCGSIRTVAKLTCVVEGETGLIKLVHSDRCGKRNSTGNSYVSWLVPAYPYDPEIMKACMNDGTVGIGPRAHVSIHKKGDGMRCNRTFGCSFAGESTPAGHVAVWCWASRRWVHPQGPSISMCHELSRTSPPYQTSLLRCCASSECGARQHIFHSREQPQEDAGGVLRPEVHPSSVLELTQFGSNPFVPCRGRTGQHCTAVPSLVRQARSSV